MELKRVAITDLKPHPKNPRVHPDSAIDKIVKSITEFGWTNPVLVSTDGYILAGHARVKAAQAQGITDVPVITLPFEGMSDKAQAYLIADNKLAELTDWDELKLGELVAELNEAEYDVELTGFDDSEVDEILAGLTEPKEEEPLPPMDDTPAVTKTGDLVELGRHRLLCGDSTKAEDVERLMAGERADVVFTDPPYGVMYKSSKSNAISGDLSQATIPLSFKEIIHSAASKDARIYICGGSNNAQMYFSLFDSYCQQMPKILVWVKETFVMRPNNYHSQYEFIYFGWTGKGGSTKYWYGDRKQSDVWQFNRDNSKDYLHPTQKPTVLAETAIGYSCPQSGIVYEPFLGSGSTLIACEKTNRKCYGMEIDPHYCDVIVRRWINYVGIDKAPDELVDKYMAKEAVA